MQRCLTILTISYSLYFVDLCSRTQVFQHYFHVPEHNPSAVSFCCRCPPNYSFPHKKIPHLGVGGICCGNDDFTPETQVEIIDGLGIKSHLVRVVKTSFLGSLTLFFFFKFVGWHGDSVDPHCLYNLLPTLLLKPCRQEKHGGVLCKRRRKQNFSHLNSCIIISAAFQDLDEKLFKFNVGFDCCWSVPGIIWVFMFCVPLDGCVGDPDALYRK